MPYKFPAILGTTRKNIAEDGTVLLTPALSLYGTLGAYIEMAFSITAEGTGQDLNPETVFDRMFSFRWKFYTQDGNANPPLSAMGFRLKTGTAIAAAAPMVFFGSGSSTDEMSENYTATLEVVSSTVVGIVFRYYCTSGEPKYAPYAVSNLNRLLAAKNQGGYMELEPGSQFAVGATGISIVATVSDGPITVPPSPTYQVVLRGTASNSKEYWTPILMKWPGRNSGNTAYHMYLSEFDVTTFIGGVLASKTHKDTGLAHQAKYDDNFTVTASSVSSFQDNIFRFKFAKGAVVSFTPTYVRAFLLRTDALTNDQHFLIDYQASIASIPASDTTQNNISGDIYAPASYAASGADYEVKFRVPGTALQYGATYRAIVVMYGTTSSEIYSGVSHELVADHHPNFYPKADIYFADYFKESAAPKGIASYHSMYMARIEVLKKSVTDAFEYYGITGDWSNVHYVSGDYVRPATANEDTFLPDVGNQPFLWAKSSGLVNGYNFQDTTDYLSGAFASFIDEELPAYSDQVEADYYITIQWEIGIESMLPDGQTVFLRCQYRQYIVARRWESEAGQPSTPPFALTMQLYRADGITPITDGTKYACGSPTILALVEKSDVLAGGGLDAFLIPETYAETITNGDTVSANIKQRRGVFAGYLPAATNTEIDAFDAMFSDNYVMGTDIDDAGIMIDIQNLNDLQNQWLVAIARPDNPDNSPFIAVNATITMVRDGSPATTVTADFTAWRAAFDALLTGADTPIDFRIKNGVTQDFSGITAGGSGNPSGNADTCEVIIDHRKTPCKAVEVVYEIEGTITGHLIRFMYRGWITLPTTAGTVTETITPSLWKIIDYDY